MTRFRHIVSTFVLLAYSVAGGLMGGVPKILCTDANGQTSIETPFTRCCDKAQERAGEGAGPGSAEAAAAGHASIIGSPSDCCDDVLVDEDGQQTVQRGQKTDCGFNSLVPSLDTVAAAPAAPANSPFLLQREWLLHAGSPGMQVKTVVLRC